MAPKGSRFKAQVRVWLADLLWRSGAVPLLWRTRQRLIGGRITILAYHSFDPRYRALNMFIPPGLFERQVAFLCKHSAIVSIDEAVRLIHGGDKLDRDQFVITIDDGYRDNFTHAFPILRKYDAPATIYLITDLIRDRRPSFVYGLTSAIGRTHRPSLDLADRGLRVFSLADSASRERAIGEVDALARTLDGPERRRLWEVVLDRLGLQADDPVFENAMLSWDEIREMQGGGVTFGAHTESHPMLARLDPPAVAREMRGSREAIEANLGRRVTTFAYPYGGRASVSREVIEQARTCGFDSAVVLYESEHAPSSMHELGRTLVALENTCDARGGWSEAVFGCAMSGFLQYPRGFKQRLSRA